MALHSLVTEHSPEEMETTCGCKIGRVATEYNLADLDKKLVGYWTGDGDKQRSTRELATYVNHRLLETALTDANIPPKDGEVENMYRLLTSDDVTSGTRIETKTNSNETVSRSKRSNRISSPIRRSITT